MYLVLCAKDGIARKALGTTHKEVMNMTRRPMPDQADETALALQIIGNNLFLFPSKAKLGAEIFREQYHPEDRQNREEEIMDQICTLLGAAPE